MESSLKYEIVLHYYSKVYWSAGKTVGGYDTHKLGYTGVYTLYLCLTELKIHVHVPSWPVQPALSWQLCSLYLVVVLWAWLWAELRNVWWKGWALYGTSWVSVGEQFVQKWPSAFLRCCPEGENERELCRISLLSLLTHQTQPPKYHVKRKSYVKRQCTCVYIHVALLTFGRFCSGMSLMKRLGNCENYIFIFLPWAQRETELY